MKKDKIDLKITNWNQVSISIYNRIIEICESDEIELNKDVKILSVLCGVDEDKIWSLSLPEVNRLMKRIEWLLEFKYPKGKVYNYLNLNGTKYHVNTNLQDFTIAQYVDFQTYWGEHDIRKNISRILSTFIIPVGKTYNEGYDLLEVIRDIEDNLSIADAEAICFFFARRSVISINLMQIYLKLMMKKMLKKMGNRETAMKLAEEIKRLQVLTSGFC